MTNLYVQTEDEFRRDFPISLGKSKDGDVRAFWASDRNEEHVALVVAHRRADGTVCAGSVFIRPWAGRSVWEVVSFDPLTLSPSILCDCGFHGFIENGQWRDA